MDTNKLKKFISKASGDRTKLIDALLSELQARVGVAQRALLERFVNDWVSKLDVDADTGRIKNTLRNKRLLSTVDTVFTAYVKTDGVMVAQAMVAGVKQILDFNGRYYKGLDSSIDIVPIRDNAMEFMKSWLGLKGNGALEGNGYLAKTVNDPKILGELKNMALRAVAGQQGYNDTLKNVRQFIDGNKSTTGLLERYARNMTYDMYSQVDRVAAATFADRLKMDYAIYEGGLIKTSRKFCKEHNGNVYTREEIMAFDPGEGIPPNYQPLTDLGGYGCRHHLNWIPYTVAVALRPDLKKSE